MRKSDALYYPNVEPPIRWLRSAALFFDAVRSFVPTESEGALSTELCEFADATKAWVPYRPSESTALLVDLPEDNLDRVFSAIASARKHKNELEITVSPEAQLQVLDHVFMHGSKLSNLVRDRLQMHGLILPQEFKDGDWWLVNERASDLIMSYIADRLAARQGWTSITDNEACYVFNVVDRSGYSAKPENVQDQFVAMMVTELVPDVIDRLSIEKYCELRIRYEPIRDRLTVFIEEIVLENRLGRIRDGAELREAVNECVMDLRKEIQSFRESTFGSAFRSWTPFALGGLITVATAMSHLEPIWAVPLAGASLLFRAIDKGGILESKATKRGEMIRLLANARRDIIESLDIKPLLIS